jgi:hypothetical protein
MRSHYLLGAAIAAFGLSSCERQNVPAPVVESDIVYQRDARTDVCVMSVTTRTSGYVRIRSISDVECTPKVME